MLKQFWLHMTQLNRERKIFMYVPDDYENTNENYPVLYMFDGHNVFLDEDATYGTALHLHKTIQELGYKIIVVGQDCAHEGNDRLIEYAPYSFYDQEYGYFNGYGQATMDFFINDLKPYIDMNYRTLQDRNHTWLAGSSCGGLMSLYGVFTYSSIYSKALVVSPYIIPSLDALKKDIENTYLHTNTSFYISWGDKEITDMHAFPKQTKACTELANILMKKGAKVFLNVRLNGRHCEEDWGEEAKDYLPFLINE